MLAQSFLAADDLRITEAQKEALVKTLVLLETGKLVHTPKYEFKSLNGKGFTGHFNMRAWETEADCGTIRCIGGTAEVVGNVSFENWSLHEDTPLFDLFEPRCLEPTQWQEITDAQAARALRSYLTTGKPKWEEAVSHPDPRD